MPWWSWILIWIALIALSLLFYLLLGIRLFRKFMTTVKELGAAGDNLGHLPDPDSRMAGMDGGRLVGAPPRTVTPWSVPEGEEMSDAVKP